MSCTSLAAVTLDKLTACEDLARLHSALKASTGSKLGSCRPARTGLERTLLERTGFNSDQLCFQQAPPTFLKDFTCAAPPVPTGATITCFRETSLPDIKTYKASYSDVASAPASKKYLATAATCGISNKDTAEAPSSMFPQFLWPIARMEFGFVSKLGKGDETESAAIHGYAVTDPALRNAPAAIEFFSLFIGAPQFKRSGVARTVGRWTLYLNDEKEMNSEMAKQFRKQNLPMSINMRTYEIEGRVGKVSSQNDKLAMIEDLQEAVAKALVDEGFRRVSDRELKQGSGRSTEDILSMFSKKRSYGSTSIPVEPGPKLFALVNENRPPCTRDGLFLAYVMSTRPIPNVRDDFGSVAVAITGIGDCSKSLSRNRTYMQGLAEVTDTEFASALGRRN